MRTPSSPPSRVSAISPEVIRADLAMIQERADAIHWSLTAAAGRAGVAGATIAKWRKGVPVIHATYAAHLARIWQELEREEEELRRYLRGLGGDASEPKPRRTRAPAPGKGAAEARARPVPA